jgi:hypothetical protein
MESDTIPKGIWYEEKRKRWRVKLVADGVLLCCTYHRDYADALVAWTKVKKSIVRPKPEIPIPLSSDINKFLCQPLVGAARLRGH